MSFDDKKVCLWPHNFLEFSILCQINSHIYFKSIQSFVLNELFFMNQSFTTNTIIFKFDPFKETFLNLYARILTFGPFFTTGALGERINAPESNPGSSWDQEECTSQLVLMYSDGLRPSAYHQVTTFRNLTCLPNSHTRSPIYKAQILKSAMDDSVLTRLLVVSTNLLKWATKIYSNIIYYLLLILSNIVENHTQSCLRYTKHSLGAEKS